MTLSFHAGLAPGYGEGPGAQPATPATPATRATRARERDQGPREQVCGVILAGSHHWGEGTFERFLRGPLVPVAQTPVICYSLGWLRAAGVKQAVVCANSATPAVRRYLQCGERLSIDLRYFEEHQPRGPAGCVRDAMRLSAAQTFVVCEGSLVPTVDLGALLDAHERSGSGATVVVEMERRRRAVGDGASVRMPGGVWVFDRRMLATVPDHGFFDIKQGLLDRLYDHGERVSMFEVAGRSPRVMDFATYGSVSRWLIGRAAEKPEFLGHLHERQGEGVRHVSAHVGAGARLIGPVMLGPRAQVHSGAIVVGPTTIGADSVIHAGAIISRSFVWERCVVRHNAIVDASVLADDSVVHSGERLVSTARVVDTSVVPSAPPAYSYPPAVRAPREVGISSGRLADRVALAGIDYGQAHA